jgi:hypothetical protein
MLAACKHFALLLRRRCCRSVVGSLLGSITLGGLFLVGFRRRSHLMVKAAIALQVRHSFMAWAVEDELHGWGS